MFSLLKLPCVRAPSLRPPIAKRSLPSVPVDVQGSSLCSAASATSRAETASGNLVYLIGDVAPIERLDPVIHAFRAALAGIAGSSPAMTIWVDAAHTKFDTYPTYPNPSEARAPTVHTSVSASDFAAGYAVCA